ncbi:MAG: apolipoprotein N-acyltransferase [Bacteroidia bacterium]|nr:apolipoprotein N-acyltransferase [Bacteroidia bacterium]
MPYPVRRKIAAPLLSITTGLLLWLSWPDKGFTPLIFIAWVPLLWAEHHFSGTGRNWNGLKIFGNFFLAMLIWNVLTTWWIWNSTDAGSVIAFCLNALLMAIVLQLFYLTKKKQGSFQGYLALVLYWIAFEYLHLNWDISWPWLTLGNAFAVHPDWVQWYQFTGVLGGSLWVLLVNLVIFQLLKTLWYRDLLLRIRRINAIIISASALFLLILPLFVSLYRYRHYQESGHPVKVAVIQPNIDPYHEKFRGNEAEQLAVLLRLASTVVDDSTSYVIGPETSLPDGIWEDELSMNKSILTIRRWMMPYPRLVMITGLASFKAYSLTERPSPTARKFKDADVYYDAFNSAIEIDSSPDLQVYHKSRLVPGVEKMPYPKIFGFLEKYAIQLGGTSGSLGKQSQRVNFVSPDGMKVAPAICYESIYGAFMSGYIRAGAQFIAVITNDGWWGNTPGYRQHMQYARLLAVEFRKCIARSANTGISCFINQRGDIISQTGWWKEDALTATIYANNRITFYARFGDYIGMVCSFLSISLLVFLAMRKVVGFN